MCRARKMGNTFPEKSEDGNVGSILYFTCLFNFSGFLSRPENFFGTTPGVKNTSFGFNRQLEKKGAFVFI